MITSGGIWWTAVTPTVFWAVIAVIAVIPWTRQAANALRSAWIPAPPPESDPAIDRTRGMLVAVGRSSPGEVSKPAASRQHREPPALLAADVPAELELGERRQPLLPGQARPL